MQRIVTPELLDQDAGSPGQIRSSLADLRRINLLFGGISTTRRMILQVARSTGRRQFSLLDVAAASGDVPIGVRRSLAQRGIQLDITLLDRSPSHLPPGERTLVGDALSLPFPDGAFDLVSCALFAHHLQPDELVRFACEALRVGRIALLINDLRRSALSLACTYAGVPLFRSHLTRHDAPASVRRAYTPAEMRSMLRLAPASRVEIANHYFFRMGVIAWK